MQNYRLIALFQWLEMHRCAPCRAGPRTSGAELDRAAQPAYLIDDVTWPGTFAVDASALDGVTLFTR